jgi:F-type H+-transporting ATPase subunit delta
MGSASRTALTAATASVSKASELSVATGVAILAAGRAIGDAPSLRAALANPVADAKAKSKLVDDVLHGLDTAATSLLHVIVAQRWSSADEMLAGIEEIGIRVIAAGSKDPIEAELFAVGRAAQSNPELELALSAKRGGAEAKRTLVGAILKGASESTTEIVRHLVSQPRGRRIRALLAGAQATVAEQKGRGIATVTVADALSADQNSRIAAVLSKRYGRDHHINVIVDQSILGGFTVQVGDDTIDASIRSRLTELSSKLAG